LNPHGDIVKRSPECQLPRGPFANSLRPFGLLSGPLYQWTTAGHCRVVYTPTRCGRTSNKCLLHGARFSAGVRFGTRSHNGAHTIPGEENTQRRVKYDTFHLANRWRRTLPTMCSVRAAKLDSPPRIPLATIDGGRVEAVNARLEALSQVDGSWRRRLAFVGEIRSRVEGNGSQSMAHEDTSAAFSASLSTSIRR